MLVTKFESVFSKTGSTTDVDIYDEISKPKLSNQKESANLWTTALFENNYRGQDTGVLINNPCVWLDFDGTQKIFDVCNILDKLGCNFYTYTTHSHTQESHRFRVIIPVDGLTLNKYPMFVTFFGIKNRLKFDTTSNQPARIYYMPVCRSLESYIYVESGNKENLSATDFMAENFSGMQRKEAKPIEGLTIQTLSLACLHLSRVKVNRNITLYNTAFKYFLTDLNVAVIKDHLMSAALDCGLTDTEARATINSAMVKAKAVSGAKNNLII